MVQPGRQAHVLRTDVGALQVQITHWACTPLLIFGGKGVVSELLSCLFQSATVT